jgi:hypothetical protein
MKRHPACGLFAALTLLGSMDPAARATAWAAEPFQTVVLPSQKETSHALAYGTMLAGAGLVGASFVWRDRANERYDRYLEATEPNEISRLFDETSRLDRLSSGALIAGEVLVAAGLYLRFVRHPSTDRVSLVATPTRCALSLRF